jgi:hypothetical protein
LKIKSSISCGKSLLVDDFLYEKVQALCRVEGSWVVTVDPIKLVQDKPINMVPTSNIVVESLSNPEKQPSFDSQDPCRWKYRIMATEVSGGSSDGVQASVERTTCEVLTFHIRISEMIANHLPAMAGFNSQQELIPAYADSMDGLRVSGQLLQKFLDENSPLSNGTFVGGKYCKFHSFYGRLLRHTLILAHSFLS